MLLVYGLCVRSYTAGVWSLCVCVCVCYRSSKPITYLMAQREHGLEKVHYHVGREPSGQILYVPPLPIKLAYVLGCGTVSYERVVIR